MDPNLLLAHMVLASTNHRISFRVWYVRSAPFITDYIYIPLSCEALLSLNCSNEGLPHLALLFLLFHYMHCILVSSNHSTFCKWREIQRSVLRNNERVPPTKSMNKWLLLGEYLSPIHAFGYGSNCSVEMVLLSCIRANCSQRSFQMNCALIHASNDRSGRHMICDSAHR